MWEYDELLLITSCSFFLLFYFHYFTFSFQQLVPTQIGNDYCLFLHNQQDGYEQLSLLPARTFKGLIRVRFINEQVGAMFI